MRLPLAKLAIFLPEPSNKKPCETHGFFLDTLYGQIKGVCFITPIFVRLFNDLSINKRAKTVVAEKTDRSSRRNLSV